MEILSSASMGDYISWFFTGLVCILAFGGVFVVPILDALGIIKAEPPRCPQCHKSDCDRWLHGEVH